MGDSCATIQENHQDCLRKRICTLLLNRILGRHNKERLRKLECLIADCHLTLLHRLEKSRLHLCRHTLQENMSIDKKTNQKVLYAVDAKFSRIQFTPDLLPADLLGTLIYSQKTEQFQASS